MQKLSTAELFEIYVIKLNRINVKKNTQIRSFKTTEVKPHKIDSICLELHVKYMSSFRVFPQVVMNSLNLLQNNCSQKNSIKGTLQSEA